MKTKRILLAAALGGIVIGGCSRNGEQTPTPQTDAVSFTAAIAATRTTDGGDKWADNDAVGIYMVTAGGTITDADDLIAENVRYNISDPVTGDLSPDSGTPIYYPQSGTVDFAAYYPYGAVTGGVYEINVADQSDQDNLNVMYAKTTGMSKNDPQVALTFAHVMARVVLDIKTGAGLAAADIAGMQASAVVFGGMPVTASLALQDGATTPGTDLTQAFNPLKAATPPTGYDASFTAVIVPQAADDYAARTVTFTVGGQTYTWTIPDSESFEAGNSYTYPVTVTKTAIAVGDPQITDWTTRDNGTGIAKEGVLVPEANCYMIEPNGVPILIPISQANRVLTADGLGAETTGLGGVEAGNFTVEMVWGDTPVGDGGVLKEIRADDQYVFVRPGIAGNAVIAIRDKADNTIKWSWHIWVTEPVGQATDTQSGLTWMDRNLGAKSNTPLVNGTFDQAQWTKTLGLYYQWGRKDAFPASDGTDNNQTYYIGNNTTGTTDDFLTDSLAVLPEMVMNPLTFAANGTNFCGSLNVEGINNDSWGGVTGVKTIYDPCPPGWKVPPIRIGVSNSWGNNNGTDWSEFVNYGRVFDGINGIASLGHFYPAGGYRFSLTGAMMRAGQLGGWWSTTHYITNNAYYMAFNSSELAPIYPGISYYGCNVRCVAE